MLTPMTSEFALVAVDEPEPWDKQIKEGSTAYYAFTVYRNLGPKRTYAAVARSIGVSPQTVSKYADQYDWQSRAEAWDFYMDRIFQAELAERQRHLAKHQFEMAQDALKALNAPIQALLTRMEADPAGVASEFGAKDLAKLMKIAQDSIRLMPNLMTSQRLALGQPGEISERRETHTVTTNDSERIGEILDVLHQVGALDAFTGEGEVGEIIEAEVVEMDDGGAVAQTDSVHDSPS